MKQNIKKPEGCKEEIQDSNKGLRSHPWLSCKRKRI